MSSLSTRPFGRVRSQSWPHSRRSALRVLTRRRYDSGGRLNLQPSATSADPTSCSSSSTGDIALVSAPQAVPAGMRSSATLSPWRISATDRMTTLAARVAAAAAWRSSLIAREAGNPRQSCFCLARRADQLRRQGRRARSTSQRWPWASSGRRVSTTRARPAKGTPGQSSVVRLSYVRCGPPKPSPRN